MTSVPAPTAAWMPSRSDTADFGTACARQLPADWEKLYGYRPLLLETLVDGERFRGTCYRAANWMVLGRTTGRGKDDQTHRPNRPIKEVLALPLHRKFRELLQEGK